MKADPNDDYKTDDSRTLAAIFDHAVDGIIIIDDRGLIEKINPAAAKLFGYTPEEVKGKNVKILMPEPYHSEHDGYLENYHKNRIPKIIGKGREVTGKRKDGSLFPFFLSVSEVQHEERTVYTGFIHDISDLKSKELELEESEKQLQAIFQTAVDGIIIINKDGIIQMANPAISKLFGYELEEMLGKNVKMLMPEPDHSHHDTYISKYHQTQDPQIIGIGREVKGKRKDGSIFPFNLGVSEVLTPRGEIIFTGIVHDLSKQKEAELLLKKLNDSLEQKIGMRTKELSNTVDKLLSLNKTLEFEIQERTKAEDALRASEQEVKKALEKEMELSELKSRFVSMASHEFRTPLSTILSSAALIGRYTQTEQQTKRDKHVAWIKSAVENLTGILNDFLSLSRFEEGKIQVQIEAFDWQEFCHDINDEIGSILKKGQSIDIKPKVDRKIIFTDRHLLKNILFNLLSNAIKYSPEDSTIHCHHEFANEQLSMTIRDEGIGIPEKDQKHLFNRFFRATNVTNIQGTGLGLNIVKKYVELLQGEISFSSQEGKGTSFSFQIPTEPPPAIATTDSR